MPIQDVQYQTHIQLYSLRIFSDNSQIHVVYSLLTQRLPDRLEMRLARVMPIFYFNERTVRRVRLNAYSNYIPYC